MLRLVKACEVFIYADEVALVVSYKDKKNIIERRHAKVSRWMCDNWFFLHLGKLNHFVWIKDEIKKGIWF